MTMCLSLRGIGRIAILILVTALIGACADPPTGQPRPLEGKYHIDASDLLEIRVFPEPLIERQVLVRPDGHITFDFIGDVLAQGRTTDEVAENVQNRIARYRRDPVVTVVVASTPSQEIVVSGEVNGPSTIPALRGIRVTNAISQAGDVTQLAAASRVRLIRRDGDRSYIYLTDLNAIRDGDESTNYLLHAGDVIFVPPATPVGVGYAMRRALYPVEVLLSALSTYEGR